MVRTRTRFLVLFVTHSDSVASSGNHVYRKYPRRRHLKNRVDARRERAGGGVRAGAEGQGGGGGAGRERAAQTHAGGVGEQDRDKQEFYLIYLIAFLANLSTYQYIPHETNPADCTLLMRRPRGKDRNAHE